jgi:asparagine synthase (glutamine-hydrolysing)
MLRYIIAVGNPKSDSDFERITELRRRILNLPDDWRTAMDAPGVYAASAHLPNAVDSAIVLPDMRGVVFGALYQSPERSEGNGLPIIGSITGNEAEVIFRSRGRSMMRDYWGYYVVALLNSENSYLQVMRSPASPLPCFQASIEGTTVFFSSVEDFEALELMPLSINWDCITTQVAGSDYLTSETAINEITSVECGECVECRPDGRFKTAYWDPRSFLADRTLKNFSEATRTIRDTTEYCVSALSQPYSHILVTLSGGLDSSIVLSSLSRCSHRPCITAINYNSRGTGDERQFARSMARSANCKLVEKSRNQELNLRRIDECNRTVRPVLNFSAPDTEARNIALARELNASAIFNGEFGDNVFGSNPGPGSLVECMRTFGLGRQYLSVAVDYAMLKKQSLWMAFACTLRECRDVARMPDFSAWTEMRRHYGLNRARSLMLASPEAEDHCRTMGDRFVHPWLLQSRRIAPGAQALLFGLIAITSTPFHSPFSGPADPPKVSPLLSQPLVEAALRMPAYLHCKYAQNRPVARAAFADVLPAKILQRGLGKGGPTLWAKDVVENNRAFLLEYLLDGILVRQRLVDRQKLEAVLSPRIVKSTVIVGDILAKLYIEAWLRKWP